jgi:competence protein ComEC
MTATWGRSVARTRASPGSALPWWGTFIASIRGSADPGLARVLATLRPQVAVIPVGPNAYGHPHPTTLAALRAAVPVVRRTDRDGTVRLRASGGRLSVETAR